MHFEIYSRRTLRGKRWFFRLRAANGKKIAWSEGYINKSDCLHAVDLIRDTGYLTKIEELD